MVDKNQQIIDSTLDQEYKYGFTTDIEQTTFEPGLNEEVITKLSKLKKEPQWLLDWRLKAYESWKKMEEPTWAQVDYTPVDYQALIQILLKHITNWVFRSMNKKDLKGLL
jgi:Fe-S cluster assembly protein SufB